jgi:hypothetical protein
MCERESPHAEGKPVNEWDPVGTPSVSPETMPTRPISFYTSFIHTHLWGTMQYFTDAMWNYCLHRPLISLCSEQVCSFLLVFLKSLMVIGNWSHPLCCDTRTHCACILVPMFYPPFSFLHPSLASRNAALSVVACLVCLTQPSCSIRSSAKVRTSFSRQVPPLKGSIVTVGTTLPIQNLGEHTIANTRPLPTQWLTISYPNTGRLAAKCKESGDRSCRSCPVLCDYAGGFLTLEGWWLWKTIK